MTLYVCMNTLNGVVDHKSIRSIPPSVIEVKHFRWLTIGEPVLNVWERRGELPLTVLADATSIVYNKIVFTLAEWKARRINDLRAKAGSLISDEAPQHLQLNRIARATELTHKSMITALSPSEQSEIESFQSLWSTKINPIRQVCNDAEELISAATTHEAVESVYSSIVWS